MNHMSLTYIYFKYLQSLAFEHVLEHVREGCCHPVVTPRWCLLMLLLQCDFTFTCCMSSETMYRDILRSRRKENSKNRCQKYVSSFYAIGYRERREGLVPHRGSYSYNNGWQGSKQRQRAPYHWTTVSGFISKSQEIYSTTYHQNTSKSIGEMNLVRGEEEWGRYFRRAMETVQVKFVNNMIRKI